MLVEKLMAENADLVEKVIFIAVYGFCNDLPKRFRSVGLDFVDGVFLSHFYPQVNKLCVELDRQNAEIKLSGVTDPDGLSDFAKPAGISIAEPESSEITSLSALETDSLEKNLVNDNSDYVHVKHPIGVISDSSLAPDDTGEIVQIPLDDNEVRDTVLGDLKNVENDADSVPITDAPLIGAPFRLISFFAKYVSGADLVNESSSNNTK